jgi:two-component sensor histidine kinase
MKVVMIDDSAAERKLCRLLLLEEHGPQLEFFEAETAAAGLEAVRARAPDCILLNYRLPDMTGLDFLARLNGAAETIAVVMLTGVASEELAAEAIKAGAQHYLAKNRMTSEGLSLAIQKATLKVDRDRLARLLAEKEVLLQEVHHRIKNNLQVVASLLRLQADGLEDKAAAEALHESQCRVESMALIYEQLHASADLPWLNLAEHAALLLNNLLNVCAAGTARISGQVSMEPLVVGVKQAIPAGLILNELLANALKHGFPDGRGGRITVAGGHAGERVELTVWNDGVELPADFEPRKTTSLGLRIVQILARQLRGTLEFDRGEGEEPRGTTFRVSFPIQHGPGGDHAPS